MSDESEKWRKACMEFMAEVDLNISKNHSAPLKDSLMHELYNATCKAAMEVCKRGMIGVLSRHGLSLDAPAGETKACEHMWRFIREVPPYYCCEKCGEPKP